MLVEVEVVAVVEYKDHYWACVHVVIAVSQSLLAAAIFLSYHYEFQVLHFEATIHKRVRTTCH